MYSIIELQTTDGTTTHLYQTATTREEAMSKYHSVLSFAATSSVDHHACIVLDEKGQYLARECYDHPKSEPVTVAETETESGAEGGE